MAAEIQGYLSNQIQRLLQIHTLLNKNGGANTEVTSNKWRLVLFPFYKFDIGGEETLCFIFKSLPIYKSSSLTLVVQTMTFQAKLSSQCF